MIGIGLIEGFFGPEWSWESRHQFCENLRNYGGEFYLYAPKRDPYLRKSWTQDHPAEMWSELKRLSQKCHSQGLKFGVGLSPFEIHSQWNQENKQILKDKIKKLEDLDINYLGLFFDDMRGADDLADKQLEILSFVKSLTDRTILFCPTYYSDDPILDKVFGQRAPDYLEKIGTLPKEIEIFWTGNKVIPPTISSQELDTVRAVLKRKPMIWENYFANDGPKQCKFLKMKPFEGRSPEALQSATGWAFNLMNQPSLSEILFAASVDALVKGTTPTAALHKMARKLAGDEFESLLEQYSSALNDQGLDKMEPTTKTEIIAALGQDRFSGEIRAWLGGKYVVGPECLTD